MTQPAITPGPVLDLSDPTVLELLGAGCELLVAELRRNGQHVPDTVAGATVRAVIAMRRAARACAPATAPDLDCLRGAGRDPASHATTTSMPMVRDVAKRLGVSRQAVRQWADTGVLPGDKDELGQWRFAEADVDAFAANRGHPKTNREARNG